MTFPRRRDFDIRLLQKSVLWRIGYNLFLHMHHNDLMKEPNHFAVDLQCFLHKSTTRAETVCRSFSRRNAGMFGIISVYMRPRRMFRKV